MKRLDKVKDQPVNELFTLSMRIADLESRLNQIEEALAQSEKRLSLIFDSVTDEINLLKVEPGSNYRVETVNKALLQHMGFTGEMIGKRIDELLPKEEYEYIRERFSQAIQTRMPVRYERSFAVLGSQKVFEVDAIPIFDENGTCTHVLVVSHDITERKQAEEILRQSHTVLERRVEQRTADLVKANQELQMEIKERQQAAEDLHRSEQDLAIRNQVANIFLALPEEEIYGEILQVILERMESKHGVFGYVNENGDVVCPSMTRDIWDQCQVRDKEIVFPREKWGGIWGSTLIEKRTFYSNEIFPVPKGHIPVHRAMATPIIYEGEAIGCVIIGNREKDYDEKDKDLLENIASYIAPILHARLQRDREETARQQAEALFRTLCDSSPIGIYITQDSKFQYVNPQMQNLLGYSQSELLGTDSASYILPADRDVVRANAIARLKGKQAIPYEYQVVNKAGEIRHVMETVNPIEYQGQRAVLGNFMDITEFKQIEREVAEYKALNKFKSDLLSTVSHELRTPLSIIKGYSTLLVDYEQKLTPEEKREYLRSTDSATDRLSELVDRLLDMSRLDAGLLTLTKELTSILKLIKDTVAEAQLRAPGHKIAANMPRRLPKVIIDARRIRQVLDNLIDNACKYSKEAEVTVSAQREGKELLITVTDQGIGIPANELQRVFDRMYRIEQRLSSKAGGMGLGLAICKGLIEAHGGRIWMESEEGKGSTCFFTLPLHNRAGDDYGEKSVRQGQFPL